MSSQVNSTFDGSISVSIRLQPLTHTFYGRRPSARSAYYQDSGIKALAEIIRDRGIQSIAIPPLGSGLGELDWTKVRSRIEKGLSGLDDVRIIIFEPKGAPAIGEMVRNKEVPKMTPGRAALVELMDRYLGGLLDPFITLLEVHNDNSPSATRLPSP